MRLFDNKTRDYMGPANYDESLYTYLDRSGLNKCMLIRDLIDEWFKDYPEEDKAHLRGRFIKKKYSHHLGAFFELYCYHYLKRLGFDLEIHPLLATGRSTHPEFLAKKNSHPEFYFECTIASNADTDQARKNQIYDLINKIDSPNFYLEIEIESATTQIPSSRFIRSCLQRKLLELDPDEVARIYNKQDTKSYPKIYYSKDGWDIVFTPIPKSKEDRGRPGVRPIGIINNGVEEIDSTIPIYSALKEKATYYGNLDLPYIIAVDGVMDMHIDSRDVTQALLGWELETRDIMRKPTFQTITDGLWCGPRGGQNQRVSAVLYVSYLNPFSIASRTPTLWHNPYALKKVGLDVWKGPQKVWDEVSHEFVKIDGQKANTTLGLDPGRPCDE